jgi:hypothetical protein
MPPSPKPRVYDPKTIVQEIMREPEIAPLLKKYVDASVATRYAEAEMHQDRKLLDRETFKRFVRGTYTPTLPHPRDEDCLRLDPHQEKRNSVHDRCLSDKRQSEQAVVVAVMIQLAKHPTIKAEIAKTIARLGGRGEDKRGEPMPQANLEMTPRVQKAVEMVMFLPFFDRDIGAVYEYLREYPAVQFTIDKNEGNRGTTIYDEYGNVRRPDGLPAKPSPIGQRK